MSQESRNCRYIPFSVFQLDYVRDGGGTGYRLPWVVNIYCLEYNACSLVFISRPRMNLSFECGINWISVWIVYPSNKRRPQRLFSSVAIVEKKPRRNADPPIVKANLCHRRATIFHDLVPSAIQSRFRIHRACNRRCVSGVHVWPFLLVNFVLCAEAL